MNRDDAICKANRIITNRAHTLDEVEELVPPIIAALIAAYNAGLEDAVALIEMNTLGSRDGEPALFPRRQAGDMNGKPYIAAIRARKIT